MNNNLTEIQLIFDKKYKVTMKKQQSYMIHNFKFNLEWYVAKITDTVQMLNLLESGLTEKI